MDGRDKNALFARGCFKLNISVTIFATICGGVGIFERYIIGRYRPLSELKDTLDDVGIYDAHIVGASMGGTVAQRYALEYSRAKMLTLLCTTHGRVDAVPIPDET
ncbi:alpha/beta hydrolase fold protein [Natronococcus jeotgali DSM 18795]|uniref:Alpha/beta hydrolase fold protein n=1 Tax=Natronococcus jeotgali DSM 18795 TaxID=1227498 RepID=L9XNU4_9EURY|nr:alpha/beta hydrolase fold protein [Natronococcus jeotgali]ELY62308.1 alpha/beta hydrolase fold protein [Natronococcus jeotgali DSM 18795]